MGAERGCDPGDLLRAAALFDAVHDRALALLEAVLETGEALVDALPAGRDQIDQQGEVVEAGVAFREQVALHALQTADRLPGQPAHLGDVAADGDGLLGQPLADGLADLARQRRLDLRGEVGECLDLLPRAPERRLDVARVDATLGGRRQTLLRTLDRGFVHRRKVACSPDG